MKHRNGFTVVELVITITIMAILMTVGVVALRSTQANGRDEQRKSNVQQITLALEDFYKIPQDGMGYYDNGNTYPNTKDFTTTTMYEAGVPKSGGFSIVAAQNADETIGGILPKPTPNTYVYQPLANTRVSSGAVINCPANAVNNHGCMVCDGSIPPDASTTYQSCFRYNLFYRLEGDTTIYKISSKNQ